MTKLARAAGALLTALGLVAAAACSGSSGNAGSKTMTLEAYTVYAANTPQGKAITWLYDKYHEEHPNITIKSVAVPQNLMPKLQAMASTNSLPDIAIVDNPDYPAWQATGKLRPLSDDLKQWGLDGAYIKGATDVVTIKGQTAGVFIGTNTLAIMYNKKMFADAGIKSLPKTWSEFEADGLKLAKPGVNGFMFSARNDGCGPWQFNPWQWSAGGSDNHLTDAGNVKALTFLTGLVQKHIASKDVVNQCQDEGMEALAQGRAAMIENGPWSFNTLNQAKNLDWGVFPIPVPDQGDKLIVPLGGEVWTLPQTGDSAREQAALNFLKWSQKQDVLYEFDKRLGYVPVMPSLWPKTEKNDPQMKAFIESLKYARGRTTVLGVKTPTQVTALANAIQTAILGKKSPAQALADAQKAIPGS